MSERAIIISYDACNVCGKSLSIAEVIEKHCEDCGYKTKPTPVKYASIIPEHPNLSKYAGAAS